MIHAKHVICPGDMGHLLGDDAVLLVIEAPGDGRLLLLDAGRRFPSYEQCFVIDVPRSNALPIACDPDADPPVLLKGEPIRGDFMQRQEIESFIQTALVFSAYLAPKEPGLTYEELLAVGSQVGLQPGEIGDVVQQVVAPTYIGDSGRMLPASTGMWSQFVSPSEDPEYRNVAAFDFVCATLKAIVRLEGAQRAQIDRSVLVAQAVAKQLPERDVEAAVTILVHDQRLLEKEGVLRFAPGRDQYPLASEQLRQTGTLQHVAGSGQRSAARTKIYSIVKDVVERRADGRPKAVEPFEAFSEALEKLGYAPFRLWWKQTVAELRHAEPSLSPVAVTVFSAALVEGALTFVVKHARSLGLGVLGSKSFDSEPRTWKIDDLVSSASAGQASAILDMTAKHRADELVRMRQRIHAGRMLSDFPTGVADLRPEEARAAKESAEIIVRRVLDWLEKYPAT